MAHYKFTETDVELAALEWLGEVGYSYVGGPDIAPCETAAERQSYRDVILVERLRSSLDQLNPDLPTESLEDAIRQLTRTESPNLFVNNHRFHRLLVDGVPVNYQDNGRTVYTDAHVVDWGNPLANGWLEVNQYSIRKLGTLMDPNKPL